MIAVWGFIVGVPALLIIICLCAIYLPLSLYIRKRQASDMNAALTVLRMAFLLTTSLVSLAVYHLATEFTRHSAFLQNIILFNLSLSIFMPVVFILLFSTLNVIMRVIFLLVLKLKHSFIKEKVYTFNHFFMIAFCAAAILASFLIYKTADYLYLVQRIESLRASEIELLMVYRRAVKNPQFYYRTLLSIVTNKNCPPQILASIIDDLGKMQIGTEYAVRILHAAINNPNFPSDARFKMSEKIDMLEQKAEKLADRMLLPASQTYADRQRLLKAIEESPRQSIIEIVKAMRLQYKVVNGKKYYYSDIYLRGLLIQIAEDKTISEDILKRFSVLAYPYRTVRDKAIDNLKQRESK